MIPDEAVEAAATELADINGYSWCSKTPQVYLEQARRVLEAAAPHLIATALRRASTDLIEAAQVIAVRSHDAGLDNEGTVHAMNTDAGWLRLQADNYEEGTAL